MSLEAGQVFAGYTIVRVLGTDGMGTTYLARHPRLPREDALKVLPAEVTADPAFRARFLADADLAAGLSHPHIARIYDRGENDGQFWITMDYLAGTDAAELSATRFPAGMPVDEVVAIITAVGSALDYAHQRGLLHLAVTPAKILLAEPDGQVQRIYLTGFGYGPHLDEASDASAYTAPEQLAGGPVDGRTDQYALACTAFHLLTGAPPSGVALPPAIGAHRPDLAVLDRALATAMATDPAGRFASCQDFAHELTRALAPVTYPRDVTHTTLAPTNKAIAATTPRRRRSGVLIGVLATVTLLVIAGGVVAAVKFTHRHQHGPAHGPAAPGTAAGPAPNAGPFTGVYRVEFGAGTTLDDVPASSATPSTASYAVRSACTPAGCVATASRLSGELQLASTVVFDEVDGRWLAVTVDPDTCRGADGEIWQVITLRPGPAGTFAGEYRGAAANACNQKRSVTFTRTGDVDVDSLPDPGRLPKRVVSPAEALRGHYHLTQTFSAAIPTQQLDYAVITDCLRTGERCMSYFHSPTNDTPLVFDGVGWVLNIAHDETLAGCTALQVKTTAQYPLPQPAQNPITTLTGHGTHQQTGNCAVSVDFDETYTRTGD